MAGPRRTLIKVGYDGTVKKVSDPKTVTDKDVEEEKKKQKDSDTKKQAKDYNGCSKEYEESLKKMTEMCCNAWETIASIFTW